MISTRLKCAILSSFPCLSICASGFCSPGLVCKPTTAFASISESTPSKRKRGKLIPCYATAEESRSTINDVKRFLSKEFPTFNNLLLTKNDDIWKTLSASNVDGGYTIFAPNAAAFEALGDKKIRQLKDERNLETVQKMASYHVIAAGIVTSEQLRTEDWTAPAIQGKDGMLRPYKVGGIVTIGGTVPVGRSKSGGFLGWGAKEDGNAVIGPNARLVQSYKIFDRDDMTKLEGIVHEVDSLISPDLLWRFMDQLRIPGF